MKGETREPARINRILAKLGTLWRQQPDTRLGQMLINMNRSRGDGYYVEDDEWERWIDEAISNQAPIEVIVPIEATTLMIDAAIAQDIRWSVNAIPRIKAAWRAMCIAASTGG